MRYAPLHVHTEYSLLDGAIRQKDLIKFSKENGFAACAVTDHGVMYGAIELYREGKAADFKVLLGCEFYVYHGDITKKDPNDKKRYHLVLLAKNNEGYKNLVKLVSIAHIQGFYTKPRINREILEKHSEGLICLSACIQGEIPQALLEGDKDEAFKTAEWYKNLFGEDYYIELQDHGLDEQKRTNPLLIEISEKLNIPLVITNDSHYLRKEDASWHDTLLCIQTNALKTEENRFKFPNKEFYVKTPEELREAFSWLDAEKFEEAMENTARIADKCSVTIKMGESILPYFEVPEGYTIESYLLYLVQKGLKERYTEITPELEERYKYELGIIHKMGYDAYFLIVWDFINYAKTHGVPVGPGRGSAAGSLAAYALGITDLDPISNHLFFERFLNPERISMPDVDIDFGDGREKVIDYVTEKYGKDKVCQIVTFGTLSAKAAIKAAARVYNIPFEVSNKVSACVPSDPGMTIEKAFKESPDFKKIYDEDAQIREIIDEAVKFEGIKQNTGMHAAGVIISRCPLDEIVPVQYAKEGNVITEYPKEDCEKIGLLKMDFLGLKNLTIIVQTLEMIKARHNIDIDINHIPLDDEKTYKMLASGDTDGVFQLESAGMKKLVKDLKPSVFEDLGALVALFRPGPLGSGMVEHFVARKHGREQITYAHPALEEILKDTYGTLVYQEQIMQIFQVLADFTLGGADGVRRIMAKKHPEDLEKLEGPFIEKCVSKGMQEKDAKELFNQIGSFAAYCFNRAHSACYAFVAYQTAYLKAHYPVEYIAAMLSNSADNMDKIQLYITEAQKQGIKVLPPDINKSNAEFTPDGGNIRFGLSSIKGIGEAVLAAIMQERSENGEFKSISDFAGRINPRVINRKAMENFAKAGVFASLEPSRKKVFNNVDNILNAASREAEAKERGQVSLFAGLAVPGSSSFQMASFELYGGNEEFTDREIQEFEKDLLGFYVTSHPLESIKDKLPFFRTHNINELEGLKDGTSVTICGLLNSVRRIPTKKDPMRFITAGRIEDLTGGIEFTAFPPREKKNAGAPIVHEDTNIYLQNENRVIITGKYQAKDENRVQIIAESTRPVENTNIITVKLKKEISFETAAAMKDMLARNRGGDALILETAEAVPEKILASSSFWVKADNDLIQKLERNFAGSLSVSVSTLE